MTKAARKTAKSVFRGAQEGQIDAKELASLVDALQAESGLATADDIDWLQVLAAVQIRLDECERAADFGLPHGEWRQWDIPFEKVKNLYDDMQRTRAVDRVQWFLGGYADVYANDIRAIQAFLCRQVQMRLRSMGLQPRGADGPTRLRRFGSFLIRNVWRIVIGVIVSLLGAWLAVQLL